MQVGKSTKNTAAYAVKQDWLPEVNDTNNTEVTYVLYDEENDTLVAFMENGYGVINPRAGAGIVSYEPRAR